MLKAKTLTLGYCPMGNGDDIEPFDKVFHNKQDVSKSLKNVDAVVFWGGTDIAPELYGQQPHRSNQAQRGMSQRDKFEWAVMNYCKVYQIPMIGVCRGAQMLCAFAGGSLYQDVTGHGSGAHSITTSEGEMFMSNSYHHQMMYPYNIPHELLAWSTRPLSVKYATETDENDGQMYGREEPEIVYFPSINGLAIQGHPEWARETRFAEYCNEKIREKLLNVVEVEV